jgi:DNA-directed RNA polymerase subunit beta'
VKLPSQKQLTIVLKSLSAMVCSVKNFRSSQRHQPTRLAKLKGVRSREAAVDKNGELVTKSIVRRERMGHINLAAPVAHIWFMRGTPSAMSLLLGMTVRNLERIAYFATYVILEADNEKRDQMLADLEAETEAGRAAIKMRYEKEAEAEEGADVKKLAEAQSREVEELEESIHSQKAQLESLVKGALINETDYRNLPEEYEELVTVGMGGTALKAMLDEVDLPVLIASLQKKLKVQRVSARRNFSSASRCLKACRQLVSNQVACV